jgi:uridine kinase
MPEKNITNDPGIFSKRLFDVMKQVNPGVDDMELYEFRYALDNLTPEPGGWASVALNEKETIEGQITQREFFAGIQIRQQVNGKIVLEDQIVQLTRKLFVGLVNGEYDIEWVTKWFYFDVRGFFFLVRTVYFTDDILAHFDGKPYQKYEQKQTRFDRFQGVGYKDFQEANLEVDGAFIELVKALVAVKGTPILLTLAGPTAAGKTEIVSRLKGTFEQGGQKVSSIEMDSFLLDNDYRDEKGIKTLGKEAYHFELFLQSLDRILHGQRISIPLHNATVSSHDENGRLKPGFQPIVVEPADIIFLEGNFPFQIEEVAHFIGIKMVYLTDDPIRLKRKWKRDMDYRKKYDFNYFRNRYFRTQFLRAEDCYRLLMKECDVVVDTTDAAIWVTPAIKRILEHR